MPGFKFVGGALCLDFVNTVGGRAGRRVLCDKIIAPADLTAWAIVAGLVRSSDQLRVTTEDLTRAIAFREALYNALIAMARGKRPAKRDLQVVEAVLSRARSAERLVWKEGKFRWVTRGSDIILASVASSAAELLASDALKRLRQCGGPECGWLFLDATRNASRRWCDMRDCGNRAKVRRYRERQAQRLHPRAQ